MAQHVVPRDGSGADDRPPGATAPGSDRSGQEEARGASFNEFAPLFVISVAANLAGMHAQTLRSYDRQGLVSPGRTASGGRRYSHRDIELLREVQRLSQDEGVNRAGIKRIIEMDSQVHALQEKVAELAAELAAVRAELDSHQASAATEMAAVARSVHASYRRDVVPWRAPSSAIVTWRPQR
ncbi:MerR family transcriptional regulator [Nakamurella silvestris]|nr:MerR family transcriptional regulator [Nakamurella silvestris]